jgi:hypothetical protein
MADIGNAGRIAMARPILLNSVEPFLPALDIIIRG